MVKQSVKSVR